MNKKHTNHHLSVFDGFISIKIIKLLNDDVMKSKKYPFSAMPPPRGRHPRREYL